MATRETFRVLIAHLDEGRGETVEFGAVSELLGGSGLAAALFQKYGQVDKPWNDPDQPVIFAIGALTGYFPLMSKVVMGFKSPYHDQYAESHAGGRMALAMRFAGYDALVLTGRAKGPSALAFGHKRFDLLDVNYLWGANAFTAGRILRKAAGGGKGHRSIIRVGPAAENGSAYACINVDTFRHFGRLGSGTALAAKNLKGVIISGDGDYDTPGDNPRAYATLFRKVYDQMTGTHMMSKYHDLGTPQNVVPINELSALPWRNLQATRDDRAAGISGETFARDLLLRNAACSGCPVGCIHLGMLRQQFQDEHRFQYRQVSYDHEPIFACGSMLGMGNAADVLLLLDEVEKQGLDVMSAGVALAWATEALEKGMVSVDEHTLVPLVFGEVKGYADAIWHLGHATNDFYRALGQGAMVAAKQYGGEAFACVLGQEMAGYATGEAFFVSQALGFRHSHLDTGGYAYAQKHPEKDADKTVKFLVEDESSRCVLTSCVSCLFARGVYSDELVAECLTAVGHAEAAKRLTALGSDIQRLRWKLRVATGFDPAEARIPKRFSQISTWLGPIDASYMETLRRAYADAIIAMAAE